MEEQANQPVGPGIHPPRLLGGMLAAVLIYRAFGIPSPLSKPIRILGIPLMLLGIGLGGFAVITQLQAETSPDPHHATNALVEDGPYRFTRNPIYLGFIAIFTGFAILMNALGALVLLPAMVLSLDRGMIRREETYLAKKFGERYQNYVHRVPRWL